MRFAVSRRSVYLELGMESTSSSFRSIIPHRSSMHHPDGASPRFRRRNAAFLLNRLLLREAVVLVDVPENMSARQ